MCFLGVKIIRKRNIQQTMMIQKFEAEKRSYCEKELMALVYKNSWNSEFQGDKEIVYMRKLIKGLKEKIEIRKTDWLGSGCQNKLDGINISELNNDVKI